MKTESAPEDIRKNVREHYGEIAANFQPSQAASCCGTTADSSVESSCCSSSTSLPDNIVRLYEIPDAAELPPEVAGLSLGCGDPITLASLQPGQTVLDLGSGGGIDCFLAARQVGPAGHVIGVDMTPAMLEKARANREKLGAENVEFRLGEIEHLPVADSSVDVIISNCVINLSPDKPQVMHEAFRVLKPGGKLAVSDMVTSGELPEQIKANLGAWAGCIAGALDIKDYINAIQSAGFVEVTVKPVFMDRQMVEEAKNLLDQEIDLSQYSDDELEQAIFSAKITAAKPIQ